MLEYVTINVNLGRLVAQPYHFFGATEYNLLFATRFGDFYFLIHFSLPTKALFRSDVPENDKKTMRSTTWSSPFPIIVVDQEIYAITQVSLSSIQQVIIWKQIPQNWCTIGVFQAGVKPRKKFERTQFCQLMMDKVKHPIQICSYFNVFDIVLFHHFGPGNFFFSFSTLKKNSMFIFSASWQIFFVVLDWKISTTKHNFKNSCSNKPRTMEKLKLKHTNIYAHWNIINFYFLWWRIFNFFHHDWWVFTDVPRKNG